MVVESFKEQALKKPQVSATGLTVTSFEFFKWNLSTIIGGLYVKVEAEISAMDISVNG